jgi:hypothetical protein
MGIRGKGDAQQSGPESVLPKHTFLRNNTLFATAHKIILFVAFKVLSTTIIGIFLHSKFVLLSIMFCILQEFT